MPVTADWRAIAQKVKNRPTKLEPVLENVAVQRRVDIGGEVSIQNVQVKRARRFALQVDIGEGAMQTVCTFPRASRDADIEKEEEVAKLLQKDLKALEAEVKKGLAEGRKELAATPPEEKPLDQDNVPKGKAAATA